MDLRVVPYQKHHTPKSETDREDGDIVLQNKPATSSVSPHHEPVVMNPKPPTTISYVNNYTNVVVKYKECMRNHAASIGGHANDGCGEFMPSGDDGTRDWLTCAACGCHRNFHRREGSAGTTSRQLKQLMLPPPPPPPPLQQPQPAQPQPQQIVLYNAGGGPTSKNMTRDFMSLTPSAAPLNHHRPHHDYDEDNDGYDHDRPSEKPEREDMVSVGPGCRGVVMMAAGGRSKRFRTKFTEEQKYRMLEFAEKIGWRIQKHDDTALNEFCNEVGVKRNVLKVWMHNNKNNHRRKDAPPVVSPSPRPTGPPQAVGAV